jgi:hypothetical protein
MTFLKTLAEIEIGMAEKFSLGTRQTVGKKTWFGLEK